MISLSEVNQLPTVAMLSPQEGQRFRSVVAVSFILILCPVLLTGGAAAQPQWDEGASQLSRNTLTGARYVAAYWNWLQTPSDDLGTPGRNTIHLSPCPMGINTSNNVNAPYAVYIAGTGTAEAVPVAGGNCAPGSGAGTITVTTAHAHAAGYTLGSASSGIQEAINDNGTQRGTIYLLPASVTSPNYRVYATVFLNVGRALLSGYGALVQCFTRSACIVNGNYLGTNGQNSTIAGIEFMPGLNVDGVQIASVSQANGTFTITTATNHMFVPGDFVTLFYSNAAATQEGRFKVLSVPAPNQFTYSLGRNATFASSPTYGWAAIENTAIEDDADHLTIRDIKLAASANQYFHWGIVVSNDQSFRLEGMTNQGGGVIRCTSNFCGAMVYGRGDQGVAPVMTIEHLEASMQCSGNGVRYAAGNTLHVMNSVVQGFNQYGIYYAGGYQALMVGGTYQESSPACYNHSYPGKMAAAAGIITNNDLTYIGDDPIGGQFPTFTAQNSGSQQNNYYVSAHSSSLGNLGMFYAGSCMTSGTGTCTTYWPQINLDGLGTVTYDLLKTVGATAIPPNGTGSYAITTGLSSNCGPSGICSYVDAQTGTSSYTVGTVQWTAQMNFWPAAVVLGKGSRLYINNCWQAAEIVTTMYTPSVFCQHSVGGSGRGKWTPYWAVYQQGDSAGNNNPSIGAILDQAGPAAGAAPSGLTGLRGFLHMGALGQTDMYTFAYSNPFLALATPGYRPPAAPKDTAIGFDSETVRASLAQLGFRAPVAISEYIGSVFDNTSYKERLTAAAKTFNVPVTINGNLTVNGTCTGCAGAGDRGGEGFSPWVPFGGLNTANQVVFPMTANTAAMVGFTLPVTVTTAKVLYFVGSTADNSPNTYEIGIYNARGKLMAHAQAPGTMFCPSPEAMKMQRWVEGTVSLPPGRYYEAIVSSCTSRCATFTSANEAVTTFYNNTGFTQNVRSSTLGTSIASPGGGYESFGASPLSIILE